MGAVARVLPHRPGNLFQHLMGTSGCFPAFGAHSGREAMHQAASVKHHQLAGLSIENQVQSFLGSERAWDPGQSHGIADHRGRWRDRIRLTGNGSLTAETQSKQDRERGTKG